MYNKINFFGVQDIRLSTIKATYTNPMKFLLAKKYGALKSQLQVKEYEENHPFNLCFSFIFHVLEIKKMF